MRGFLKASVVVLPIGLVLACTSPEKSEVSSGDTNPKTKGSAFASRKTASESLDRKADARIVAGSMFLSVLEDPNIANKPVKGAIAAALGASEIAASKARMEKLFEYARSRPREFFKEMRELRPIYKSDGAAFALDLPGHALDKDKKIPDIYLLTKYADVTEVLDQKNHTTFSVKPYAYVMDPTVGTKDVPGSSEYMLGREAMEPGDKYDARAEKQAMHDQVLKKSDMGRVRKIIRKLARAAISSGAKNGRIDIVDSVTRRVPIQMNGDYFGFPGPSYDKMAQWSRATQHAFFHNPFRDKSVTANSIKAGAEMREYINDTLIPEREIELKNGRPAYDPVSRMLKAASEHQKHGLDPVRIVANTIGLLVGSVETTSAAIAQLTEYLVEHPEILNQAMAAAQKANAAEEILMNDPNNTQAKQDADLWNETFDRYVWEALRFRPVNPWLARYVEKDYVVARGTARETTLKAGSLLLISTESAMNDEEVFQNPDEFRTDRDQSKFFHLGYQYHRCLGDDVALVMVPETVKQMFVMLQGLSPVKNGVGIDQAGGPFPEKFVLKYKAQPKPPVLDLAKEEFEKFMDGGHLLKFVYARINGMPQEKRKETLAALKTLVVGSKEEKERVIPTIAPLVVVAMQNFTPQEKINACLNDNPKSKEAFPVLKDRENYCAVKIDFRGCYFVQRLVAKKSSQSSFNYCAYGPTPYLNPNEIADFKSKLSHVEMFDFLNFAE